jgi:hypothetical protein
VKRRRREIRTYINELHGARVYSRAMPSRDAALEIRTLAQDLVPLRVRASGHWTFRGLKEHSEELARDLAEIDKQSPDRIAWDLNDVGEIDDAGAVWLVRALRSSQRVDVSPGHREILNQVGQGLSQRARASRSAVAGGLDRADRRLCPGACARRHQPARPTRARRRRNGAPAA